MKMKIAVIDDDIEIRELVEAFFRQKDFLITQYEDAESAIADLRKDKNVWDVALVDLHLPKMTGIDLITEAKQLAPSLPIVLITTTRSADTAVQAIQKGAYDFIVKPIHFPQLFISVQRALKHRELQGDITELREQIKTKQSIHGTIIGKSPRFLEALDIAKRVSGSLASIFISGDSGTGKEVFARFIHNEGKQKKGPFVAINCSAIPENLLESELFGHAKGAFTGAQDKKLGLFEEAQDGTLFLDEIGDLSLPLQAKLLRVLQEKKIKRVGENIYRDINCRLISATHKNLAEEVRAERFREDLFFRLNVIPIHLPTLRDRKEDILPLAESFLKKFAVQNGVSVRGFNAAAKEYMLTHHWKGNVRELENAVERAVVLSTSSEITKEDFLPLGSMTAMDLQTPEGPYPLAKDCFVVPMQSEVLLSLDEVMNKYIEFAVKYNEGAKDKTAREIGIDRKTLYKRLHKVESSLTEEIEIVTQ